MKKIPPNNSSRNAFSCFLSSAIADVLFHPLPAGVKGKRALQIAAALFIVAFPVSETATSSAMMDSKISLVATPNEIPGPPPMPVFGSRGNFVQFLRDPIAYLRRLQTHGPIVRVVGGRPGIIFAFGPEFNQQVLSNPNFYCSTGLTIPGPKDSAQRRLGDSIFNMNADKHAQQRRLILPALHKKSVEGYRDAFAQFTARMLDGWKVGQQRDVAREMKLLMMTVSGKILFGFDDEAEGHVIGDMANEWMGLSTSFPVRLLPRDWPGTPYHRMLALAERLEEKILNVIRQRRAHLREGHEDILSALIRAHDGDGGCLNDSELIGQVNFMYAAGHETTSNAMTWTLFLLAQHPDVMADLLDELTGRLHGDAPTVEQMRDLPLLDRVIKESMRLLAPPVYNTRTSVGAFELGPYSLPKGSTVGFSHYITHHMPELYPQPEKFLPDRWLTINPSPFEYLPFGAGPRMCPGAAFATMAMKVSLPMILQRYRLAVVAGARIDRAFKVTLTPKHGMPMIVSRQDRQFTKATVRGNIHEMVDLS